MSKQSRLFVVDASILYGAGEKEGYSAVCMSLLNAILTICHRAVITKDILQEWNKHQSNLAKKWRASMVGQRKLVKLDQVDRNFFDDQVTENVPAGDINKKRELLKDTHLLAAAYAADKLLLTADVKLYSLCKEYGIQQNIEWLTVSQNNGLEENGAVLDRLRDLATTRPNPPLPKKP
jgi:predicted nuclease of predicted toxin-antitoxin system